MKTGLAIAQRREELGMSQVDLAKAVGVSKASVCRWESGDISNMRRDRIQKLADALKISPLDLLEEETEGFRKIENAPAEKGKSVPFVFISYNREDEKTFAELLRNMSDEDLKQAYKYALYLYGKSHEESK